MLCRQTLMRHTGLHVKSKLPHQSHSSSEVQCSICCSASHVGCASNITGTASKIERRAQHTQSLEPGTVHTVLVTTGSRGPIKPSLRSLVLSGLRFEPHGTLSGHHCCCDNTSMQPAWGRVIALVWCKPVHSCKVVRISGVYRQSLSIIAFVACCCPT